MKRHLLSCIVCILVLSQAVHAELKFGGGVSGGVGISGAQISYDLRPLRYKFKDNLVAKPYSVGFAVGANGTLGISKHFAARLSFEYMRFAMKGSTVVDALDKLVRDIGIIPSAGDLDASGGANSVMAFRLVGIGKLPTGSIVSPYASFGLALAQNSITDIALKIGPYKETWQTNSEWAVGITYGLGAEFSAGKVNLFLEINDIIGWLNGRTWGPSQVLVGGTYGV